MIDGPASTIELTPISLDDVDRFSEWEVGLGRDIESTQLSTGSVKISFDHFDLSEMLVGHFSCSQSMQNVFAVPEGVVIFLVCRAKLPALWCDRHIPPVLMPILRYPDEHFVVLPPGWDCYEFMVSEELIRETELFPPDFFDATATRERAVVPLLEPITGQFLRRLDVYFAQARSADTAAVRRATLYDDVINKDGWDKVLDRILEELKGKKVFITFDMDGVDPVYAPGVGTQEPDGLSSRQALQLVRAVGIQNEIVAAEFNEYNPMMDDAHMSTGILLDRITRSLLAGIAARKQGITDPLYMDPDRLDHGN